MTQPLTAAGLARLGEDAAAAWLVRGGYTILDRNYRVREGEIDIVARRGGTVAFVEVKARRSARFGTPGEAVNRRKAGRIRAAAQRWLADRRPAVPVVRFDVIEMRWRDGSFAVAHIEGAF